MNRVLLSSSSAPSALPAVPPGSSHHGLTPNVLLIVIILTIIFFLSALLHLLVRFLVTVAATRYRDDAAESSVTALQGQLRQLFHLHDAGLDQSFIDNLPLFVYKAIIGSQNDPFDCAVCLCQFEPEDELRLIPRCNHAFHVECIDTWLLSHSTCPLCRANLLHDGFSLKDAHCPCSSPAVVVLESGSDTSQELGIDLQSMRFEIPTISGGFGMKDELSREEKVMEVKLGKFRNLDDSEGSICGFYDGGTNSVDGRRCFSMGSFAYVTDDTSALRVPIGTAVRKQPKKKRPLLVAPGHHLAMLVRNYESMREFAGFERDNVEINDHNSKCWILDENETVNRGGNRKESFSVSKIWLRDKKERPAADSSRRACSFRLPITRNQETLGSELRRECDKEGEQSNCSGGSLQGSADDAHASSFARKTLHRILGRQNVKVVHSFENA